jgi:plasmid stabilization system protein ParE
MAEIIWTENALQSLDEVADYIAVSSPSAASKLVVNLFEKVDRLELFPESGRLVEEVKEMGYREVIVNPCRVMYKIEGETVFILHVIRQERDLRKYLINEPSTE